MNRRNFLYVASALSAGVIMGGSYTFLNDKPMIRPPKKQGYLLTDLHAHVPENAPLDELLSVLSNQATVLAEQNNAPTILSYNELINHSSVKEVDKGKIAKVTYNGNVGYIIKGQEIKSSHHILSVGASNLLDRSDPREAIASVQAQGGLAILAHWYISTNPYPRMLSELEAWYQPELLSMVDEMEVYTAVAIKSIPFTKLFDFSKANNLALEKLNEMKKNNPEITAKGIAVSDAHKEISQVGLAGIYLEEKAFRNFEELKYYIQRGLFERCDGHPDYLPKDRSGTISRGSAYKEGLKKLLG